MTDNTFTEAPQQDGDGTSRKLVFVGGGVAVAVLAGAGWFLLHSGSSSDPVALTVVHRAPRSVPKVQPAKTLKSKVPLTQLPAASSVKIGRDPFAALYVVSAAAGPAAGTPATGTATGTATPAPSSTDTSGNARYSIVLTKITTDPGGAKFFTFKIGTTLKEVLPAQRFGKYGELVVLSWVKDKKGAAIGAILQVGDDNPIGVPIGVKTSVQ